ncbi:hypothetical protein PUR_38110 [Paenibacillus sp. URB8-2]|nr:hypothetical protein PUR_38110 [Paenibacillus sp. URB8-2]
MSVVSYPTISTQLKEALEKLEGIIATLNAPVDGLGKKAVAVNLLLEST